MENYEQVQALSDGEVIERINHRVENVVPGVDFWYRELERRHVLRSMRNAERLTRMAVWLTGANAVVACVAALAAILSLA